jgi:lipid-binding SYLF domain-containing protein
VINDRGVSSLLHSKVKLGADATAAAGPKGRDAEAATDAYLRSDILTYSRARGVFAGVSLEGSTLRSDDDANKNLYGRPARAAMIVRESKIHAPASAHMLVATLQTASPALRP